MRAIEITAYGAPDVLKPTERPTPVAGAGELLIRVAASGVNRPDVLQRKGHAAGGSRTSVRISPGWRLPGRSSTVMPGRLRRRASRSVIASAH